MENVNFISMYLLQNILYDKRWLKEESIGRQTFTSIVILIISGNFPLGIMKLWLTRYGPLYVFVENFICETEKFTFTQIFLP